MIPPGRSGRRGGWFARRDKQDSGNKANDGTPDGQQFLMVKPSEQEATQIHVVLNWFEELKRRVPTGNDR